MVEMVVAVLKRSDFTCWPDQGGFLDQEMTWIEDVFTYMALERREKWANDHERMEYEDSDFKPLSLDELG